MRAPRGEAPRSVSAAIDVSIEHVPFAEFRVDVANLKRQGGPHDRFMVLGNLRLGNASDGLDLLNETVAVTFGTFSQRIPGRLFLPRQQMMPGALPLRDKARAVTVG